MMNYCPQCAGKLVSRKPETEDRDRLVCVECAYVFYQNPKVVVNAVTIVDGKVLLILRGIEPRVGYWALPGGYLEYGETVEEAATREVREETGLDIAIDRLLNVYTRVEAGIINVIYLAEHRSGALSLTEEATELRFFPADEVPWAEIAFPSHRWALQDWAGHPRS